MIRKVHIGADGSVTDVQFGNETSNYEDFQIAATENQEMNVSNVEQDVPKSLRTWMKNLFRREYLTPLVSSIIIVTILSTFASLPLPNKIYFYQ